MGEGWGEGGPLPLIPSHQGRGNGTFYETITFRSMEIPLTSYSLYACCILHLLLFFRNGKSCLNHGIRDKTD